LRSTSEPSVIGAAVERSVSGQDNRSGFGEF
jgi:hypothetical protein